MFLKVPGVTSGTNYTPKPVIVTILRKDKLYINSLSYLRKWHITNGHLNPWSHKEGEIHQYFCFTCKKDHRAFIKLNAYVKVSGG